MISQLPKSSSEKPRSLSNSLSVFKISTGLLFKSVKKTLNVPSVVAVITKSLYVSSASTTPSQSKFEKQMSETISSISGLIDILNS